MNVYIVFGECGGQGDHEAWPIKGYSIKVDAETHRDEIIAAVKPVNELSYSHFGRGIQADYEGAGKLEEQLLREKPELFGDPENFFPDDASVKEVDVEHECRFCN